MACATYSIRITEGAGEYHYFDLLGRTAFHRATALRILRKCALQGLTCDLVRN